MISLFLALAPALAQQDASLCKGGFSDVDWRVRLDSAGDALGSLDVEVARRLLDRTRLQMVCLDHVADPKLLGRMARQLAWLAFIDQDETGAVRWLLLARATDPGTPLPATVPQGLKVLDEDTEDPPLVGSDGRLVPPKGGGVFLDGALLLEPRAPAEVPGLLQVADGDGDLVVTAWIDSGVIPDEWLGSEGPPPRAPRWYRPSGTTTVQVERSGSGLRVAPLVASGGLAVLAGALYGLGAASTGGLETATSEDALAAARSRTNLLAMGSLALGAGAVGVGVVAFVSADASVNVGFRF